MFVAGALNTHTVYHRKLLPVDVTELLCTQSFIGVVTAVTGEPGRDCLPSYLSCSLLTFNNTASA